MFFDAIVGLTVFKSGLDDGFFFCNFWMLDNIIVNVMAAKQIHIVEKNAILFPKYSRHVCLTIAADLNDLLQTKVRIQIETLLYKCLLYTVGDLLASLFGNLFKLALCLCRLFDIRRFRRSVRLLFGGRVARLGGQFLFSSSVGSFCSKASSMSASRLSSIICSKGLPLRFDGSMDIRKIALNTESIICIAANHVGLSSSTIGQTSRACMTGMISTLRAYVSGKSSVLEKLSVLYS